MNGPKIRRFACERPALVLGLLTAACLLGLALAMLASDWPTPQGWDGTVIFGLHVTVFAVTAVAACLLGCWLGRAGLPTWHVLKSLLWLPLVVLAIGPLAINVSSPCLVMSGGGLAILAVIPFGSPFQHFFPPAMMVSGPLAIIVGHLVGWGLAERITRKNLRAGRWEHTEALPVAPKPYARWQRALIGGSWAVWLLIFLVGFKEFFWSAI